MNFIKNVFRSEGVIEEGTHQQFMKFSRGVFKDRALIKAKKSGSKITINTSAEFANELVKIMAQKLGNKTANITGAIISTSDLKGKLNFKEIKQFHGVKKYLIETSMSGKEIIELINGFPKCFFALTFDVDEKNKLKIKPKAPKSGKPSTKGASEEDEEMKTPNFCKLITNDNALAHSFVFEKPDFKQAEFKHTFAIESIVIPPELKKEKDFAIVREKSLRKGKIIREGEIDGQKLKEEKEFEA